MHADHALDANDLVLQFGTVGEVNGARTGYLRRTSASNEAFLGRRLMIWLADRGLIDFPVSVEHSDRPDFVITSAGLQFGLEVTEACDQRDGAELAKFELAQAPQLLGAAGGRGDGGYHGSQAESEVISDIQNALWAKSEKPYVLEMPTDLLIYVNSNPARMIDREEQFQAVESHSFEIGGLRRVFLYWSERRITQIAPGRAA